MPDPTDSTAEAQPLKGEEPTEGSPHPDGKKGAGCWSRLGLSRLSNWRTAGFFLSLFLCLIVVFAFSFIIPCPVRPVYLRTWNHSFPLAASYDFLAIADANSDKVLDVLFVVKAPEGSLSVPCVNQSLPSPCVFLMAVAGTNGETLWERALAPELRWAQCRLEGLGPTGGGCLLSHADQLTAVNHQSGEILWQMAHPPAFTSKPPVLSVPDLDNDGVSDLVLIGPGQSETLLAILSGKTGAQIGSEVIADPDMVSGHSLYTTSKGSLYVLLQKDSGVYGKALWKMAAQAQAGSEKSLKKDQAWEKRSSPESGEVLLYKSDAVQHVLRIAHGSKASDLVVVTQDGVEALTGDGLKSLWKANISRLLSEPSLGHFNKDGTADVVIEEDTGNGTKRVAILDGSTGGVLWEANLRSRPNAPRPSAINTISLFSVFVLWGEVASETNSSSPAGEELFSYLLNPQYSSVLLERRNLVDHIVAFKAALLERGRHACYLTLTGPPGAEEDGPQGPVTLSKRKLKDDIPESRVLRLGQRPDEGSDDEIRDAFERLRFSKDI